MHREIRIGSSFSKECVNVMFGNEPDRQAFRTFDRCTETNDSSKDISELNTNTRSTIESFK